MVRHCRECGLSMRLHHDSFRRAGGYKCRNRNCPNCPHFRYRNPKGKIVKGVYKATLLDQWL